MMTSQPHPQPFPLPLAIYWHHLYWSNHVQVQLEAQEHLKLQYQQYLMQQQQPNHHHQHYHSQHLMYPSYQYALTSRNQARRPYFDIKAQSFPALAHSSSNPSTPTPTSTSSTPTPAATSAKTTFTTLIPRGPQTSNGIIIPTVPVPVPIPAAVAKPVKSELVIDVVEVEQQVKETTSPAVRTISEAVCVSTQVASVDLLALELVKNIPPTSASASASALLSTSTSTSTSPALMLSLSPSLAKGTLPLSVLISQNFKEEFMKLKGRMQLDDQNDNLMKTLILSWLANIFNLSFPQEDINTNYHQIRQEYHLQELKLRSVQWTYEQLVNHLSEHMSDRVLSALIFAAKPKKLVEFEFDQKSVNNKAQVQVQSVDANGDGDLPGISDISISMIDQVLKEQDQVLYSRSDHVRFTPFDTISCSLSCHTSAPLPLLSPNISFWSSPLF